MPRILLCSPAVIKQELGAPRVLLGVAQGLRPLGWDCTVVGPEEIRAHLGSAAAADASYTEVLRAYLRDVAGDYDVVDYPYGQLPFPRTDFPAGPVFVARSVLLDHHFPLTRIPEAILPHQRIKRWLTGGKRRQRRAAEQVLAEARATLAEAQWINVANDDDRRVLIEEGLPADRILVIPYGMSDDEFESLSHVNTAPPTTPRLCFLGTFDNRKGGADLPRLFAEVCRQVPNCRFRLIGTAGQHQTAERVLSFFPRRLRGQIEIVPRFRRDELAGLLGACSVGVFPSYIEGFGFAVLEMLSAGLPVVAYDSPGPPMMLSPKYLVPRGDITGMASIIVAWLTDPKKHAADAAESRRRARDFSWRRVGELTDTAYRAAIASNAA